MQNLTKRVLLVAGTTALLFGAVGPLGHGMLITQSFAKGISHGEYEGRDKGDHGKVTGKAETSAASSKSVDSGKDAKDSASKDSASKDGRNAESETPDPAGDR